MSAEPEPEVRLGKHAAQLAEHFDATVILASRLLPDGSTQLYVAGQGNWYARMGMAQDFVDNAENFLQGNYDDAPPGFEPPDGE